MLRKFTGYGIAAVALATAPPAAAINLISNGGFEAPNLGAGHYVYPGTTSAGWTYGGAVQINAQGSSPWYGRTAPAGFDGRQFAGLQFQSTLSQNFMTTKTGSVELSWLAGGRPNFNAYDGNQTYAVAIDGVRLGVYSTTNSETFRLNRALATNVRAGTHSLTFTALGHGDHTAFIDDVVAGVPEPAIWAQLVAGLGLIGAAGRRRKRFAAA